MRFSALSQLPVNSSHPQFSMSCRWVVMVSLFNMHCFTLQMVVLSPMNRCCPPQVSVLSDPRQVRRITTVWLLPMTEEIELDDLSREELQEIIRHTQRRQSLRGDKDVMKATAEVVRKKSAKLEAEISEASQRATVVKSLDACFVLDCTSSMKNCIQAAKDKIVEIQSRIVRCLGSGGNVRFSVVGYRDYEDEKHFEIQPFTDNVKDVQAFLSNLKAEGGGDVCEDVIGALSHALKLNWQARTRIIYLICDTPPHGKRFAPVVSVKHLDQFDDTPDDNNQWEMTDALMADSVAMSLNLVMLCYTDLLAKTFQVFSDLRQTSSPGLQTLCLKPANKADDFVECILASTKETLSKTLTQPSEKSRANSGSASSSNALSVDVKKEIAWKDWNTWPLQQVLVSTVDPIALASNPSPNQAIQRFHIRQEPFGSGSMRSGA